MNYSQKKNPSRHGKILQKCAAPRLVPEETNIFSDLINNVSGVELGQRSFVGN